MIFYHDVYNFIIIYLIIKNKLKGKFREFKGNHILYYIYIYIYIYVYIYIYI